MNNRKATKRALLTSAMALVMCVVMLVGTTFAWFTDTARANVNKIQAGNLDVDMVDETGASLVGRTLSWQKAAGGAGQEILWEPGATYNLNAFRIVNKGSLALKYEITVNGVKGSSKLLEAINFTAKINGREEALNNLTGVLLPKGATTQTADEVASRDLRAILSMRRSNPVPARLVVTLIRSRPSTVSAPISHVSPEIW